MGVRGSEPPVQKGKRPIRFAINTELRRCKPSLGISFHNTLQSVGRLNSERR